ncbi:protoporphyrinogen oxidase [[Candida] anglica]
MSLTRIRPNGSVAVLGVGISGLSFAYFLNKLRPDVKITLYEQNTRPGGWINTDKVAASEVARKPVLFEKGPRTLRGVSEGTLLIVDMLKQLGKAPEIEVMSRNSVANNKYILGGGGDELVKVGSFRFHLGDLTAGLIRAVVGEPFRRGEKLPVDESIESFVKRRFGSTALSDNVLSAVFHGIYAGDVARLSARSVIPAMVEMERAHGSIFMAMVKKCFGAKSHQSGHKLGGSSGLSQSLQEYEKRISQHSDLQGVASQLSKFPVLRLQGGLQELPNAVANHLESCDNVNIVYGAQVAAISKSPSGDQVCVRMSDGGESSFDHFRSTINTKTLANLLAADSSSPLRKLPYVSVLLVNVYSKSTPLIPQNCHGFGFLVPKKAANPERLLGVIFDSDIAQNVEPFHKDKETSSSSTTASGSGSSNSITLMFGGHFYNQQDPPMSSSMRMRIVREVLQSKLDVDLAGLQMVDLDTHRKTNSGPDRAVADTDILVSFNYHQDCIPQYEVGYSALAAEVEEQLHSEFKGTVSLGGMAFGNGIGVPDCVQNGLEDALKLA